ncbi:hypothetical protein M2189_006522 [Bradyrhizobium japonicum]|nr:hypothetical protein [Bradyrhizobium japonicum]MCS3963319.1 hypothetical protein [Bradyrhizobium japonicum]MCS3995632.1 hypothetical protein [Bradyrhizobium japonicum]
MSWLHLYAAVQTSHCNTAQWTSGASGLPVFPAPSFNEGKATKQSSGEMRREDASPCQSLNDALVPRTLRSTK